MKFDADKKNRAQTRKFVVGDIVLPRQQQTNKFSTPFQPEQFRITEVKGSMITATSKDRSITRNASHFKLLPSDIEIAPYIASKEREDEGKDNRELPSNHEDNSEENRRYPVRSTRNTKPDYKP